MQNLYKYIGEKIRELRSTRSLSQEEFGKKIDVPTNTISRWETAVYKPSAEDLLKIGKAFGVTISYFFPENDQLKLTANLQALMSATSELNEEDVREITEYAKFRRARAVMVPKSSPKKKA